tara:strand:- start:170 stop:622 length:453 start_codon:yes stop_codon:yes gene_type:complete
MIMTTLNIQHIRAIGNSLMAQVKAQDKTSDARFELAKALQSDAVDLENKVQAGIIKAMIDKAYPKATKDGCPDQLKKAGAVRQVCSTHKKAFKDGVSAVDHETYSQFRNAVYGDQSKSKRETIMSWVDSDKISFTLAELEAIVAEYKAIK